MNIEIHELQKLSPKLLTSLYADKRLALTPAIAAICNNYYPSIEQILDTLRHYCDVDIVIEFVRENATAIDDAKNQIEQRTLESAAFHSESGNTSNNQWKDDWIRELAHRPLKSVAIEKIESAISKALLELTGRDYEVNLNRLDLIPDTDSWISDSAQLELKVKKKNIFDSTNSQDNGLS